MDRGEREEITMKKKSTIAAAVIAVLFGIVLGLAKEEDRNYSYKA